MSLARERSLRGQSRRYALIMQRLDRRLEAGPRLSRQFENLKMRRATAVGAAPEMFRKHLGVHVGKIAKPSSAAPTVLIIASGALTAAVAGAGIYPGKPWSSGGSGAGPVMPGVARMTGGVFGATDTVTVAPVDMPERASAPRLLRS